MDDRRWKQPTYRWALYVLSIGLAFVLWLMAYVDRHAGY